MFHGLFCFNLRIMKIKDLCQAERPRERLLASGADALSSAELLAILLRTGSGGRNAIELSHELLGASGGSLVKLSWQTAQSLTAINGIGQEKAAALLACFELARRWLLEVNAFEGKGIYDPSEAYHAIVPRMKGLDHEECWAMFLNRLKRVLSLEMITKGIDGMVPIDAAKIAKRALELNADSVIIFHNHPSGDPTPSNADLNSTEALRDALVHLGKKLLDHIIVSDDRYFSFSEGK